ncbi:MAG: RlmE family RNA methyltransferase [Deltaproteobacteria bacterium]|jgi:23S rRNA (uridine2552-2'-O)-methyltransferase|nr:RlmE family RNA methyltransferase [Deltaproteobacteria bacterium]
MTVKDRRRLDDHWSRKARQAGYPARSVWKLEEFDRKWGLFRPGQKVLDLGCSPGGWTLYAAQKVGPTGLVLGFDLQPPDPAGFPPQAKLLQADVLEEPSETAAAWGPFAAVLSDMAPKTTGRREVDQARSLELCQAARRWAEALTAAGGLFMFKIFESPQAALFVKDLGDVFERVRRLKPQATRVESMETFVLAQGFKGVQTP